MIFNCNLNFIFITLKTDKDLQFAANQIFYEELDK